MPPCAAGKSLPSLFFPRSPKRDRGESVRHPNPLCGSAMVATRIPIARASGFLKASDAMRSDPRCFPPRSPERDRGESVRHPNSLYVTATVATRIPIARAPGFLGSGGPPDPRCSPPSAFADHGAGRGVVSPQVPQLRWRHPADARMRRTSPPSMKHSRCRGVPGRRDCV